ncbi:MAG: D-alanine--D-alanine ligase [Armatimonadetes bacterium]|nr:D-alanine--D-alanine ligase [Armatimonadota bacterium]
MRKQSEINEAFAPTERLSGFNEFFLVGIGGAGMSALARLLKARGFTVSGSDSTASIVTGNLNEEGIPVTIGHRRESVPVGAAVILTDAIDLTTSPEVAAAREQGNLIFRRSQALGWVLQNYRLIAVTGTHGKTTTTGLVGFGLIEAGLDPLVVVGADIPQFGGPVREGKGEWAVAEACEAYNSFHDLNPQIVVLTNLEHDHVDFHKTFDDLKGSVLEFLARLPKDGLLVYCEEDAGALEIAAAYQGNKIPYRASHLKLAIPGHHNEQNASGALAAIEAAGANAERAKAGLAKFGGAERRLQVLHAGEVAVVDDYAHHPTEIEASIQALRAQFPSRRLVVVFQPHLYSRTNGQFADFAKALDNADLVVLTDIYPAREDPIPGVSSARIVELLKKPSLYVPARQLLVKHVAPALKKGDVVVGMGAGNIASFAPDLVRYLTNQADKSRAKKVIVLSGGESAEREVSLHSGRQVFAALQRLGYAAKIVDPTALMLGGGNLTELAEADAIFLAVHGPGAEDGKTQGLLELLHVPYTGCGVLASALCMDKHWTKQLLADAGLPVPKGVLLKSANEEVPLTGPWIVKPNCQGSTVGLSFVEKEADLKPAIAKGLAFGDVLVEEWVTGLEITVPILGDRALPIVEIQARNGRYDFGSKYEIGATEEICPARISAELTKRCQDMALTAHRTMGCEGATRVDMILRNNTDPIILEINTLPGMTQTSSLPNSARATGIGFDELVDWLVKDAMTRYAEKKAKA